MLTFRSDLGHELSLKPLEREGAEIQLLGVTDDAGVQIARVFVPEGKLIAYLKLVGAYAASIVLTYVAEPENEAKLKTLDAPDDGIRFRGPVRQTKDKKKIKLKFIVAEAEVDRFKKAAGAIGTLFSEDRENGELIDSVASIRLAIVEDFWQDRLQFPKPEETIWWEVWLRGTRALASEVHRRFTELARIVGISTVSHRFVAFPERVVVHARATAKQISSSVDLMAMIGELRKGKELATYYVDLDAAGQAEFIEDVVSRFVPPGPDAPSVCILDGGVNRSHPLLEPALAEDDQYAAQDDWGVSDHDHYQHGTGMAGNALHGCLTEVMQATGAIRLRHKLESAKILPKPPAKNEPPDYGRRMQDGVALAHIKSPKRNRVICMAVTADDHRDGGVPSLWSGAVDDMCVGVLDGARKLMFISAGNMRDEICEDGYVYHDWNTTRGGIEDPGQAWNALTVGAFTEKVNIEHHDLQDWEAVAESGDLCPTSRTSLAWPTEMQGGWPIKPDLVMEGGNYARRDEAPMSCDDLSLLTTIMRPDRLLTTTRDTSPATALAARMAAIIWSHYPKFWPETVRAMLVHSAKWTPAMTKRFPDDKRRSVLHCLRCYGYGVPDLGQALNSASNAVTMIYEGELQPFRKEQSKTKTNHMHVHELSWPLEVLEDLREERVSMRVTLSYFVEPSPNNVGWGVNHRYASHGLRFDVIRPTEGLDGFRQRISSAYWDGPNDRPKNAKETRNWVVGENGRSIGSLHSDWWTGTAAELARSGRIIVYPVSGWWRERKHLGRYDQTARYSLIVSIKTKKTDIYTPITNVGTVHTEVMT
ncbi:MAG: S8 family peptidase [Pirellulaceae bacterium]|nr:S8 family peptidase [Pirellulaceae bacterium]